MKLQFTAILLDACNLQLQPTMAPQHGLLKPEDQALTLESRDVHYFPQLIADLSKYLSGSLDPAGEHGPCIRAVFDGAAFDGTFSGMQWTPEVDDGDTPWHVSFMRAPFKADDTLVELADAAGKAAGAPAAIPLSGKAAAKKLEAPVSAHAPHSSVLAKRTRSLAGRHQRERREAFLRTCGLPRVGDTTCLLSFSESQRDRSLSLVRGLDKLDPAISFFELEQPTCLVVTDDRGLRRRCFALPNPPLVIGRAQLINWILARADDPEAVGAMVAGLEEKQLVEA